MNMNIRSKPRQRTQPTIRTTERCPEERTHKEIQSDSWSCLGSVKNKQGVLNQTTQSVLSMHSIRTDLFRAGLRPDRTGKIYGRNRHHRTAVTEQHSVDLKQTSAENLNKNQRPSQCMSRQRVQHEEPTCGG